MALIEILFYLFSLTLVASCSLVISVRNQVYSVLFLILAFFNASGLLVLIGAEFMAMMFVIVYVGAIAVLFLFVVMMLEVRHEPISVSFRKYVPTLFIVGGVLVAEILLFYGVGGPDLLVKGSQFVGDGSSLTNTQSIGLILYTDYFLVFQIVGLILLVAMIAAIVLTLHHDPEVKRQKPAKQIDRKAKESVTLVAVQSKEKRRGL